MYKRHEIGKEGEFISKQYLIKNNYKIIETNFKCKIGEIDIITFDKTKKEIVFIEVKTRTNKKFGTPKEAVDTIKQNHIYKVAQYYLLIKKLENVYCRIDVIEVYIYNNKFNINHLKNDI